jgi:hypothetical protein
MITRRGADDSVDVAAKDVGETSGSHVAGGGELIHVDGLGGGPETLGEVSGHLPDGAD